MSNVNLSNVNNWLHVVNKLPYLTSLFLDSCNLSNICSVPLVNSSTSLDGLYLSYNNLTGVIELYLNNNQFQGWIPNDFTRINSLAHLYLDSNKFEGEIPKAFGGDDDGGGEEEDLEVTPSYQPRKMRHHWLLAIQDT